MIHRLTITIIACAVVIETPTVHAQSYRYDFELRRDTDPALDDTSFLEGEPGQDVEFDVVHTIETSKLNEGEAPQGWSLAVWTAGITVDELTVAGTAAATVSEGGFANDNPNQRFRVFESIDPATNGGRSGWVSAVVLSFNDATTIPPNSRQSVGIARCRATVQDDGSAAFVRYEDGLSGSGQPVSNNITVDGSTEIPALAHRRIVLGSEPPEESDSCTDGIDNDRDGWTDCGDPDCFTSEICGREICDDGIDNDADESVDCADEDCARVRPCIEQCDDGVDNDLDGTTDCADTDCLRSVLCGAEICDDGQDNDADGDIDCADLDCVVRPECREVCDDRIDNDLDGAVDCDDADCTGVGDCPGPEICDDGRDNDIDGNTDCRDSDCRLAPACREICDDGIDNNFDGAVDCADSDCSFDAACREICDDGIDNDFDGSTDCDDTGCRLDRACREPEDCGDGIDNDLDEAIDCDDPDCFGVRPCPDRENCQDGLDNDQDGLVDCTDPDCQLEGECVRGEICGDGTDNDLDGLVDCDDPDCADSVSCPLAEDCTNGSDDDGDGLIDCDDPGCAVLGDCGGTEGFDLVLTAEGAARTTSTVRRGAGSSGTGGQYVIYVPGEESVDIEVTAYAVPFPRPQPVGIQGWALSVAHDSGPPDPRVGADDRRDRRGDSHQRRVRKVGGYRRQRPTRRRFERQRGIRLRRGSLVHDADHAGPIDRPVSRSRGVPHGSAHHQG